MTGPDVDPVLRMVMVTEQQLDPALFEAAIEHPCAGARVVFCGVVREVDQGREVTELEYQAHPSAQAVLGDIATGFADVGDVLAVAVAHRVGVLGVGDIALVAAVATEHRRAGFAACGELVEQVKARLPVWKRQSFADGTDEWVNCP